MNCHHAEPTEIIERDLSQWFERTLTETHTVAVDCTDINLGIQKWRMKSIWRVWAGHLVDGSIVWMTNHGCQDSSDSDIVYLPSNWEFAVTFPPEDYEF